MKLVFFTYSTLEYGGGVARYFIDIASQLKKQHRSLDITIVTFHESLLKKILFVYSIYFTKKIDTVLFKEREEFDEKLNNIHYIKVKKLSELHKYLQQANRIYTTNNLLELLILNTLSYKYLLPQFIIGFHIPMYYPISSSFQNKIHNRIYKSVFYYKLLSKAEKLHVINIHDEKILLTHFPKNKIYKIYNPFNSLEFNTLKEKLSKSRNQKINILWIGRLTEQKGVSDLLSLIVKINSSKYKNKLTWNIVGEGELRSQIILLQKDFTNVRYLGYISHNQLASIYTKNDIFICTSHWESFPYTLLEAQSFNLPVISYNIDGCNDIIENGINGYLVNTLTEFEKRILEFSKNNTFKNKDIRGYIKKKFEYKEQLKSLYKLLHD